MTLASPNAQAVAPWEDATDKPTNPERVALVSYYARISVRRRRRIAEIKLFFSETYGKRIPATERGLRDVSVLFDHFAEFIEGAEFIDVFLESSTSFNSATRSRLKHAALAGPIVRYNAQDLGQIFGLTWDVRTRLNITTFDAVDAPSAEVRLALSRAQEAAYKRESRAAKSLLPKPPSAGKRKAAELSKRRLAAIHAAVGPGEGMSVTDLCEILRRQKNGAFFVSASSLRRVVHRVIEADPSGLQSELRPFPGRPDLKAQMWVARRSPPETVETTMTNPIKAEPSRPTNKVEFCNYFAAKLTEVEVVDELWLFLVDERKLQIECGLSDQSELVEMLKARRDEITRSQRP